MKLSDKLANDPFVKSQLVSILMAVAFNYRHVPIKVIGLVVGTVVNYIPAAIAETIVFDLTQLGVVDIIDSMSDERGAKILKLVKVESNN